MGIQRLRMEERGKALESRHMVWWEMPQRDLGSGDPTSDQLRHTQMAQPDTKQITGAPPEAIVVVRQT